MEGGDKTRDARVDDQETHGPAVGRAGSEWCLSVVKHRDGEVEGEGERVRVRVREVKREKMKGRETRKQGFHSRGKFHIFRVQVQVVLGIRIRITSRLVDIEPS